VPLPPGLTLQKVNKINGQGVAERKIGLAEHTGGVEAAVEGHVEQNSRVGIPRAARVVLQARVHDHLGYELVRGVPIWGGEWLAKAVVSDMRAHVGVYVEALTTFEES